MPAYSTPQAGGVRTCLYPGDSLALFNAEVVTTGEASIPFNRALSPSGSDQGTTFSIDWTDTPTGSTVVIQGSNIDTDGDYITLYTSTAVQHDVYTDIGRYKFYRAKCSTYAAGTSLTVIAQR